MYMTQWSGWVGKNYFTEGSNGSLARCVFGPKPKHRLHQAADCIITHTEEVFCKVNTEAHKNLQQRRQPRQNKTEESDSENAERQLSGEIIPLKSESSFTVHLHGSNSQINRNYQIKMLLVKTLDLAFLKEISAWLYSFVTYIEISDEANDSMAKLMQVIEAVKMKGEVSTSVVENTILFIDTKFRTELPIMGNWMYMVQ